MMRMVLMFVTADHMRKRYMGEWLPSEYFYDNLTRIYAVLKNFEENHQKLRKVR